MEGRSTLLLLVALCALAGTASANTYTVCWGPEDLLRALALAAASPQNQSIIELPRDIQLAPSHAAAYALPLRLDSRLVLRRGEWAGRGQFFDGLAAAPPCWPLPWRAGVLLPRTCQPASRSAPAAVYAAQDAGPVSLDLGGIRQLLLLQPGAELQLADLSVSGGALHSGRRRDTLLQQQSANEPGPHSASSPPPPLPAGIATAEGRLEDLPTQARQLALFPTINAEPGALVRVGCRAPLSTRKKVACHARQTMHFFSQNPAASSIAGGAAQPEPGPARQRAVHRGSGRGGDAGQPASD